MNGRIWSVLLARSEGGQSGESSILVTLDTSRNSHFRNNETTQLTSGLEFQAEKILRTSIITAASLNVFVAVSTLICISWDCYVRSGRHNRGSTWRGIRPNTIGGAEIYLSVLSCGIVGQGIIFAVIQSEGLRSLMILDCMSLSQLAMPAIFITPYIQLVLGFETVVRALYRNPFPPRWRWALPICFAAIVLGLLGTYIVTLFFRPPNFCYANLFWLVEQWNMVIFALLTSITGAVFLMSGLIFFRLRTATKALPRERRSASQMVWYLLSSVFLNALTLPFFYMIVFKAQNGAPWTELSMIASVAANLSGIVTGSLYFFFRFTQHAEVQPKDATSSTNVQLENHSQKWASNTSPSLAPTVLSEKVKESPLPPSPSIYSRYSYSEDIRPHSNTRYINISSRPATATPIMRRTKSFSELSDIPSVPSTFSPSFTSESLRPLTSRGAMQNGSYRSSFLTRPAFLPRGGLLPTTTYTPTSRTPNHTASSIIPRPGAAGERHQRNSSFGSSCTVQIGLRISNMLDARFRSGLFNAPRQSMGLKSSLGAEIVGRNTDGVKGPSQRPLQESLSKELPRPPEKSLQPLGPPAFEDILASPSLTASSSRKDQWAKSKAARPNGAGIGFPPAKKPRSSFIPGFKCRDADEAKTGWI